MAFTNTIGVSARRQMSSHCDEVALAMRSDILPAGFECGVLKGKVAPGSTVAYRRGRPDGSCRVAESAVFFASLDHQIYPDHNCLAIAKRFGDCGGEQVQRQEGESAG
jgi:hypothetical protein